MLLSMLLRNAVSCFRRCWCTARKRRVLSEEASSGDIHCTLLVPVFWMSPTPSKTFVTSYILRLRVCTRGVPLRTRLRRCNGLDSDICECFQVQGIAGYLTKIPRCHCGGAHVHVVNVDGCNGSP
jgi:hypothetical protein